MQDEYNYDIVAKIVRFIKTILTHWTVSTSPNLAKERARMASKAQQPVILLLSLAGPKIYNYY